MSRTIQQICEGLLNGETVAYQSDLLGISPRHHHRRYNKELQGLLTKDRYLRLMAMGYNDQEIAKGHGYCRQMVYLKKIKWFGKRMDSPKAKKPKASQSVLNYSVVQIRKGDKYYNYPRIHRRGESFALAHRIIMLEHLLSTNDTQYTEVYMGKRTFKSGVHVHHKDGDKKNNSIDNLSVYHGGDHIREHWNNVKANIP